MKRVWPGVFVLCGSLAGWCAEQPDREAAVAASIQDVRILSPEWICVVVDPTAEILAERHARFGDDLLAEKTKYEAGDLHGWYWAFAQQFRMLNVQRDYHQPLFASFNRADFWTLNGGAPADVTVWSHSIDGFPNGEAGDAPASNYGNYSRTADMVYLRPAKAIRDGDTLTVAGRDGRAAALAFDDEATPCWAIKVNQSAYDADAAAKRAYLGMWLPGIGPVDYRALAGQPFHVRPYEAGAKWSEGRAAGEPVFTGTIQLRMKYDDQEISREGGANATGEEVYELDFSGLSAEGLYCIQIPGLGRSWPFRISRSGYAEAFFTMMKGLYIQRCGCALTEPYTAWVRPACHLETRQGRFIPESERWYGDAYRSKSPSFGFRDESGRRVGLSAFTLIGNEDADAPVLPEVCGGWHDAADFDRRIHHYAVVHDLLALFEFFPERFRDGQLNLPESGNGIPDLLDEAAYGVEVWRRTQREDGAVSSWIEQESHPGSGPTLEDAFVHKQMAFFASTPDRAGSFAYAASAAWLGRLLTPYDRERGEGYIQSARRAYAWADQAGSVMRDRPFTIGKPMRNADLKGKTLVFDEDPELTPQDRAWHDKAFAAAYLYAATREPAYQEALAASQLGAEYPRRAWNLNPVQCLPLLTQPGLTDEEKEAMRGKLLADADGLVESQQKYAYRLLWRSPDDGWFHAMGWGTLYQRSRLVVAAYAIGRDPRYKAALEQAADFFLGCNPMGQTMVTGLGTVYPVVHQHIHSISDGIAEPTPGIAPYTFTFGVPMRPFALLDGGHPSVSAYFTNIAAAFIPDKLGRAEIQAGLDAHAKAGNWTQEAARPCRTAVWKNFPVFRRKVTHPASVVDQNEFTVNETVSPLALLFGALTADDWTVPDEIRNRRPRRSLDEVPYYSMP